MQLLTDALILLRFKLLSDKDFLHAFCHFINLVALQYLAKFTGKIADGQNLPAQHQRDLVPVQTINCLHQVLRNRPLLDDDDSWEECE